jgi:isoleucyl-tRNA synthetase
LNAIAALEQNGIIELKLAEKTIQLDVADVEISSEDIPGWLVATEGKYTVALDVTLTEELLNEGIARELVNRIQNFRKEEGLEVTDKINLKLQKLDEISSAVEQNKDYICSETLAKSIEIVEEISAKKYKIELDQELETFVSLSLA